MTRIRFGGCDLSPTRGTPVSAPTLALRLLSRRDMSQGLAPGLEALRLAEQELRDELGNDWRCFVRNAMSRADTARCPKRPPPGPGPGGGRFGGGADLVYRKPMGYLFRGRG